MLRNVLRQRDELVGRAFARSVAEAAADEFQKAKSLLAHSNYLINQSGLHDVAEAVLDAVPREGDVTGDVPGVGAELSDQEEKHEELGVEQIGRDEDHEEGAHEDDGGDSSFLVDHVLDLLAEADEEGRSKVIWWRDTRRERGGYQASK